MTYYLDYMAATPLCKEAASAMRSLLEQERYGNPSSIHPIGKYMRNVIETARENIAEKINAEPSEIIFTSGATEAAALAMNYFKSTDCAITLADTISHKGIYSNADIHLGVDKDGNFSKITVRNAIEAWRCWGYQDILICTSEFNNEIGTCNFIRELANTAHESSAYILCDATASIGHFPVDVKKLDVDYLCVSGEKIGGPSGVGFLYVKNGSPILPMLHGTQEFERRGGTENVYGIAALGAAVSALDYSRTTGYLKRNRRYNETLTETFKRHNLDFIVVSAPESALAGLYNVAFKDIDAHALMYLLSTKGIYVSSGSACSSGDRVPSRVLTTIGVPDEYINGAIRLTFGEESVDIDYIAYAIVECVKELTWQRS